MTEVRASDLAVVEGQLGRPPASDLSVVVRCSPGHPLVIRNHPIDRKGRPFPTLYWLTCPDAVRAVSRLESEGWIRRLADRAATDPEWASALDAAHRAYAEERDRLAAGSGALGGVTGSRAGIKCLHAHYAHHLAGGPDPVGAWVAARVEPVHPQGTPRGRVAAVDIGTNSIRLLIADPGDGDVREIGRDMVITRLGEGVDRTGALSPAAIARTIGVLDTYARRARAMGASAIRVAATSAVRDASNRDALVEAARDITGSPLEVLSGEREAGLSFLGATVGLDAPAPFLVFDIGGGSTELVLGTGVPQRAASADVGSVRITERIRPADPPTDDDVAAMRAMAAEALARLEEVVPRGEAATLVGVAGTTTTIQAVNLGLQRYDPERIHRTELRRSDAEVISRRLARMTTAERAAMQVMAKGREDVIVAGSQILLEILERWGFDACLVSERDILDGLAIEMVTGHGEPLP